MPSGSGKSSLAALLGERGRKAHEQHKGDETNFGFQDLPEGIKDGVAQLQSVTWGTYKEGTANQGQPYVMFKYVAIIPKTINGRTVEGRQFNIMKPLCPTKSGNGKVVEYSENHASFLNELRKVGVDTKKTDISNLESIFVALTQQKTYVHFSTRGWTPDKTDKDQTPIRRVFPSIDGTCEAPSDLSSNGDGGGHTEDASEEVDVEAPDMDPDGATAEAEADLEDFISRADTGDEEAMAALRAIAIGAGVAEESIDTANNWGEVGALIEAARGGDSPTEGVAPEPEKPWEPVKEDIYHYSPIDPKTKRPVKKPIEVEVLSVDKKSKTVTLLNNDNKKTTYKGVKWAELSSAD